ncbi:MAG: hypothetical protein U0271_09470 [Polyangiaceae bacterium]
MTALAGAARDLMGLCVGGAIMGLALAAFGLFIMFGGGMSALVRDAKLPLTPLSAARPGTRVRVRGVAQPGPRGVELSPAAAVPTVFYETAAQLVARRVLHTVERLERDFYIVDGAAWLLVSTARISVVKTQYYWTNRSGLIVVGGAFAGPLTTAQQRSMGQRLGGSGENIEAVLETRIEPGELISVVGWVAPTPNGLGLFESAGAGVRVFDSDEAGLTEQRTGRRTLGGALLVFGALMLVGAIVAGFML